MSGDSNSSTGSSTANELAAVLAGASTAYLDSQAQPGYVTEPVPGTAYGPAGYAQPTGIAGTLTGSNSTLLIVGLVVVAVFLLRR